MALLVGGTTGRSEAASRKGAATNNHSTTVSKTHKTQVAGKTDRRRREEAKARSIAAKSAGHHPAEAMAHKAPLHVAAQADKKISRAGTPRLALGVVKPRKPNTRSSSPRIQPPTVADQAALRDALARRRAWSAPRQPFLASATVKDPPTKTEAQAPAASPAPTGRSILDGRRLALAHAVEGRAHNDDLIREALSNRGTPYIWGGASRGGFDCSGFTRYVFLKERRLQLPHSASAQAQMGRPVAREELQPGDMVFFSTYRPGVSHVGIYVGDNRFIHAANRRKGVRMDALSGYYTKRYKWARRVTPAPLAFTPAVLNQLVQDRSVIPPSEEDTN